MKPFRDISIRHKTVVIILAASTCCLLLASACFVVVDLTSQKSEMSDELEILADTIATNSMPALSFDDRAAATEVLATLEAEEGVRSAYLLSKDGSLFAQFPYTAPGAAPPALLLDGPGFRFLTDRLVLWQDIEFGGQSFGSVYIETSLDRLHARLTRLTCVVAVILLFAVLVAFALSALFQRVLCSPILRVAAMAQRVAGNDYSARAVKSGNDEVGTLVDCFNDMVARICERDCKLVRASREARESEGRTTAILQSAFDGIITIGVSSRLETLNKAAEKIFGYRAEEIAGRGIDVLIPSPYCEQLVHEIAHGTDGNRRRFVETRCEIEGLRKGGARFPMSIAMSEATLDSRRLFAAVIRDMTREHELEQMKSDFVSTVSHEIRTPLSAIVSSGKILTKRARVTPEVTARFSAIVVEEGERLNRLINDLLYLSKMDAGATTLTLEEADVEALAKRTAELAKTPAKEKRLTISVEAAQDLPLIRVDVDKVAQVMVNLLNNAIKFAPEGGTIRVTVDDYEGQYIRVAVSDTGVGVAPESHSDIFERFKQIGDVLTDRPQGTGLGLAICKDIVERLGGRIWVESELGKGATFLFTLPIVPRMRETTDGPDRPKRESQCKDEAASERLEEVRSR